MKEIYNEQEAADYLGLTQTYLHSLRRTKRGPTFTKPSARVIRYRKLHRACADAIASETNLPTLVTVAHDTLREVLGLPGVDSE